MSSAAVGMATHRMGRERPRRRASMRSCAASRRRLAARAARLPKNGRLAGETTVMPSSVCRASRA